MFPQDLGLDYLDLYLIHWPQAFQKVEGKFWSFPKNEDGSVKYDTKTPLTQVWKEMEELVDVSVWGV